MMNYYWRYTEAARSKKNHAFYEGRNRIAVCGYFIPWYIHDASWKEDEENLSIREECKRCTKILPFKARHRRPITTPPPAVLTDQPTRGPQPPA